MFALFVLMINPSLMSLSRMLRTVLRGISQILARCDAGWVPSSKSLRKSLISLGVRSRDSSTCLSILVVLKMELIMIWRKVFVNIEVTNTFSQH